MASRNELSKLIPAGIRLGRHAMSGGVWIRCPLTAREVSTGIETDRQHFDALPAAQLLMICPACGKEHWWTQMKPTLVEADRRDRSLIASAVA